MKIKMKTQIQPTPIVSGESAKRIEELMKIKPTEETELGKKILEEQFKDNEIRTSSTTKLI